MALSATAKAGLGGSLGTVTVGGPIAAYAAWDHVTLYAVEREVISTDLKLTVSGPTGDSPKTVTITAPNKSGTTPGLENGHTWTCKITIDLFADSYISHSNLVGHIQAYFQNSSSGLTTEQKYNKKLLVKACSKKRNETSSHTSVEGSLKIKKSGDKFVFEEHSDLDFLLEDIFYEVENKVFSTTLGFKVESEEPNAQKVIVSTSQDSSTWQKVTGNQDQTKYYWECKITGNTGDSSFTNEAVKALLPAQTSEDTNEKNNQKKHLVKLCSKHRVKTSTGKQVMAEVTVPTEIKGESQWKEYLFGIKVASQAVN